jgi:hypothetical protein
MDESRLDALLDDVRRQWRVPPETPVDEIWNGVSAELDRATRPGWRPGWLGVGIAAAAALVLGVAGGRYWAGRSAAIPTNTIDASAHATAGSPAVSGATPADDPNQRAMGDLLGRTAVLLAELPADTTPALDPTVTLESEGLLTQTRLLLDSPVARDARMRALLDDLELVLVQVARLEPAHRTDDLQLIHAALADRDIVPRLRSAAATYADNNNEF